MTNTLTIQQLEEYKLDHPGDRLLYLDNVLINDTTEEAFYIVGDKS